MRDDAHNIKNRIARLMRLVREARCPDPKCDGKGLTQVMRRGKWVSVRCDWCARRKRELQGEG